MSFITGTSATTSPLSAPATSTTAGPSSPESVAFHFNGTSWSKMTIPANVELGPVLAFSATNLWSVNDNGDAEQFNGSTWTTTKLPDHHDAARPGHDLDLGIVAVGHLGRRHRVRRGPALGMILRCWSTSTGPRGRM